MTSEHSVFLQEADSLIAPSPQPSRVSDIEPARSATSKTTRKRTKSSALESEMDSSTTLQSGLMSQLSPEQGLEAMLSRSLPVSHVSRSRSLASELARKTRDICSATSSESLLRLDASSSFWKTSQACLFPTFDDPTNPLQLQTYLDSWPKAALIVHGCLYPRKTWELRTAESAGGASRGENWLTPSGQANTDHTGKIGGGGELDMQVKRVENWPTPAQNFNDGESMDSWEARRSAVKAKFGNGNGFGTPLGIAVRQWQTPSSTNFRTRGGDRSDELGLDNEVKKWPTPCDDDANNATRASGEFKNLTRDVQAWATPRANSGRSDSSADQSSNLTNQASNWATPRAEDAECAGSRITRGVDDTLYSQTRAWGTPRADEYKGTGPKGSKSQQYRLDKGYLDAQVEEITDRGKASESLNPDWEELLMGWPIGWTDPARSCDGTFSGWPMGQCSEQHDYEPPRTRPRVEMPRRTARVKMLGNGIVPQCATAAYTRLLSLLLGEAA